MSNKIELTGEYHADCNMLIKKIEQLEERNKKLRKGINAVHELIDNSYGISGLHNNGDDAPWGELLECGHYDGWLADFSEACGV